ncbi:extracellular solute-binding protein family 3 [Candidatus Vecturithrix granuli]|uniref:Extracellular solute-binding protein family 3 n=1 Tax=Vecturithrix granuli TaxID=1499967 RepID=A0A081BYN6_VECG1|nr:extracellular solute-binding protein family 3 [Candidatus Vecturithrix granuli]
MKFLRYSVVIILASVFFCNASSVAQTSLKIATEEWPPYVYEQDGKITGYSIDILNNVFTEMDVTVTYHQYPWKRALKGVFSGTSDALFHASKNEERLQYCYYPEEYLAQSRYVFFIRKEDVNRLKFDSFDDLLGHDVGITQGYSYTAELLDFLNTHKLAISTVSDESNLRMLAKGRIEYFPTDVLNGLYLMKKLGLQDQLTYLPKPIFEKPYFIMFNKYNVSLALVEKFSAVLAAFKQTEEFRQIEAKYLE